MRKLRIGAVLAASLMLSGSAAATSLSAPLIPGNTVDLIWLSASNPGQVAGGLGTSNITLFREDVHGPQTLTLAVVQTVSSSVSLGGIFGAIAYDLDLGDELNGAGAPPASPPPAAPPPGTLCEVGAGCGLPDPTGGFFMPSVPGYDDPVLSKWQESTGAQSGYGLGLDAINGGVPFMIAGPTGLTFTAFTVTFTINNPDASSFTADGNDVFFGAFGTGNIIGTDGGSPGGDIYTGASSPWAGAAVNFVPEPGTAALIALGLGSLAAAGRGRRSRQ